MIPRWPAEVRLVAAIILVVALGAGALSWAALTTFAAGAHIDARITWIYPVVVDGLMAVGTVAALVLRAARLRTRAYVWSLIGASIGVSVAGNAAHASGAVLPPAAAALVSAVPAAALAASLHLLVILVRAVAPETGRISTPLLPTGARTVRAPAVAGRRRPEPPVVLDGRMVSAGHARKLRARQRAEVSDAA